MRIIELDLCNFMSHDRRVVRLPASGVVLVQSPNGAGKTALIEAVSVACWDETLRKAVPWRPQQAGYVKLTCEVAGQRLVIQRSQTEQEKTKFVWAIEGQEPVHYPTPTKAQAALETIIGRQGVWSCSSVYTSSDVTLFTEATDADRKRLIEQLRGLDRFDRALKDCRQDRNTQRVVIAGLEGEMGQVLAQIEWCEKQVSEKQAQQRPVPVSPEPLDPKARERVNVIVQRETTLRIELRRLERLGGEQEAFARSIEQRLARLGDSICPSCGQVVASEHLKSERERAQKAHQDAARERQQAAEQIKLVEVEVDALARERQELDVYLANHQRVQSAYEEALRAHQTVEGGIQQLALQVAELEEKQAQIEQDLGVASRRLQLLQIVEKVLDLQGVRAQILKHTLPLIQQAANRWLSKLSSGWQIKLTSFVPKADGELVDKIGLDVVGLPKGYAGASSGQRRRINVALVLALAEVAASQTGRAGDTLFVDEVFDSLDAGGREAVLGLLPELARDRVVVLLTHDAELAARVQPELRITLGE